jgi:hypothetical protein
MVAAPAVAFVDLVLAVHILAVVAAFGVVFAYPLFGLVGARLDPSAMPWFHRMQQLIGRRLINPGLLVVLLAGVYLASKEHQWSAFYVQWGLAAVVAIGALEGAFMIPREGRLAELAKRDLAAGPDQSPEYKAVFRQASIGGGVLIAIVIVTIFLMATHAGA